MHIVVPFMSGTDIDILARALAPWLSVAWGQAVLVDNRPGASGNLGSAQVARAADDGQTLLMAFNSLVINPAIHANMGYDPLRDLAPVGLCTTCAFLLVANADARIRSVDQLVQLARARPDELNYASSGIGSAQHMAMALFEQQAGISMTHIPFSATTGAITALLSGEVALMFLAVHVANALARSGRLVVLATAGAQRSALAPAVPTLEELGYPGVEADLWYGLLVPRGTSRDIVTQIDADMTNALDRAEVKKAIALQGMEAAAGSPEEMSELMRRDEARWAAVARHAGFNTG